MFQTRSKKPTMWASAVTILDLTYHGVVRSVRKTHGNALMSILLNMLQAAIFVLAFYVMFDILGLRGTAIRGDFLLYIMSGVFLYMTHAKTMGAVFGAEGPASPMMQHAPMNTVIAILSAAFGALYIQVLSMFAILFIYYTIVPFTIDQPLQTFGMLLMAWYEGMALGMVLLALKPWNPTVVGIISTVYQRANMIASGKMFLANSLPGYMRDLFDWNPLFHIIDQARGFAFINYEPRYTTISYPLILCTVFLVLGLLGEFYTRRAVSLSWSARS
jgi:ABC-type polysaccharide/polyol phosphate export permease